MTRELPPLPAPVKHGPFGGIYTASQMREYASLAQEAQPTERTLSVRSSEWRALSPEAQKKLEQITGAEHPETRLRKAQAAEAMRGVVLGGAQEAQPLTEAERTRIILQCNTIGEAIDAVERAHGIGSKR